MTSKKLLRILLLFILLPLVLFTISTGSYLFITLKKDKLDAINHVNSIYMTVLVNDARYALTTGNTSEYQELIDKLVQDSNGLLVSIELINNERRIIASAPAHPDVSVPAVRVPVMISQTSDDLLDIASGISSNEVEGGYIEIRYNDNLSKDAINNFIWLFGILFSVFLIIILITAIGLRHKVFVPINRVLRRIDDITEDRVHEPPSSDDFLSSIDHGLNVLVRKQAAMSEDIHRLKEDLKISRSRVDMNNVTKVLVVNDLISRIDQSLASARDIFFTLSSEVKNDQHRTGMKLLAANLNDMNKTIRDASILMDQIGKESHFEQTTVIDFYNGLFEYTRLDSITLVPALLCPERYKSHPIQIDRNHLYQLVGIIYTLAAHTGRNKPEIFLTVRIEFRNEESYTITIELKDSGLGLDADTVRNFGMFLSHEIMSFQIPGFPIDDLQMIKYLASHGGMQVGVSSEYGRGTLYKIVYDREQLQFKQHGATSKRLHGAILHNGIKNHQLREHFHSIGIDIDYVLQYEIDGLIDDLAALDFVIVEFTTEIEYSLNICRGLLSLNKAINIIPAYSEKLEQQTSLRDLLFDLKIRRRHIPMPYGAAGIIEALRGDNEPANVIDKILQNFTKQ